MPSDVIKERGPYDSKQEATPVYQFTQREYKNEATAKVRLQKRGSGMWWVVVTRERTGRYL